MASISRGRDPQARAYSALRVRGRRESKRLEALLESMSSEDRAGAKGESVRQQQQTLEEAMANTKLGRNATSQKRLDAKKAANKIESLVPRKGTRESKKSRQERENRIYREQIRSEEAFGVPSARFGGEAGEKHLERIFYMATQSIWRDKPNEERDQAIMKALGVESLEDAYTKVLEENEEAQEEMERVFGKGFTAWQRGDSDPIMPYINNIVAMAADR